MSWDFDDLASVVECMTPEELARAEQDLAAYEADERAECEAQLAEERFRREPAPWEGCLEH